MAGLNGTNTPQVTSSNTSAPAVTQAQQEANTKAAKDNGTDINREPKSNGQLCDLNKDDPLGSRPLEVAVNQEITHRYGLGSQISSPNHPATQTIERNSSNIITGMKGTFDAMEGKSGTFHATMDAATSEMILDDKAGVNSAIGVAKAINGALSKVPPSELDHCFTTVVASAAYAYPDLAQKLKKAIELANKGDFKGAAAAAKAAVSGAKLGTDLEQAFLALGSGVQTPPGMADDAAATSKAAEPATSEPAKTEIKTPGGAIIKVNPPELLPKEPGYCNEYGCLS
jgi:hypothetical protein